jgi:hypothetical protein
MNKVDSAGLKFKILRELGEDVDISFVKFNDGVPSKLYVRGHEFSDGLGFLSDLFEFHYKEKIGSIPTAKTKNKPGLFKRFFYFCIHIIRQRPRDYVWLKNNERSLKNSEGFCHFNFGSDIGKTLSDYCRLNKVNVNSLFLSLFDEVSAEVLLTNNLLNRKRVWMIPVSLRTESEEKLRYGNFVTTLSVYTDDNSSAQSIYKQMSKMLKSGLPWGGLWVANISKVLGEDRMRVMSTKDVKPPYVGLITNLGKWSFDYDKCLKDRWALIAPVSRFAPVSVSLFEWNEELSLTMQLHPMLKRTPDETEALFKSVIDKLGLILNKEIDTTDKLTVKWKDLSSMKSII